MVQEGPLSGLLVKPDLLILEKVLHSLKKKKLLSFKFLHTSSQYSCFSMKPPLKDIIRGQILMDNPCLQM